MHRSQFRGLAAVACAVALSGCAMLGGHHDRGRREGPREAEWHPPRAMLLRYDANHDGSVTRAEMDAGLKADFARADTNRDGRLDEDEVRAVNKQRWSDDASTASPLVDWNHDGTVDFEEFAATERSLFDQMDANGDGILTPDELNPRLRNAPGKEPEGGGRRGGHGRGRGGQQPGGDGDGD